MRRNIHTSRQQGIVTAEFAIIAALVLLPLLVGVADFSIYINARHVVSRAVQQGCMVAVQGEDPAQAVSDYLSGAGLDPAQASIVHRTTGTATGSETTVRVVYDVTHLVAFPWDGVLPSLDTVEASAVVRRL
jgi:Flp pilus assembly protein TadG